MNAYRRALCAAIAAAWLPARADTPALPLASDLHRAAQGNRVLLVLFSLPGCHYCDDVRSQHLVPMHRHAALRERLAIVEVDISSDALLHDASGNPVTHRRFAASHGVSIAPTVMALGAGGAPLGNPLIGAGIPDFYGYYLQELLERALAAQGFK